MLDTKSKLVLNILSKECAGGTYKIIECSDIIMSMPKNYRVDFDGIKHILNHLERLDMISIKYDDDEVFCLAIMPNGFEELEQNNKLSGKKIKSKYNKITYIFILIIGVFITSFLGCLFAFFIINLIK